MHKTCRCLVISLHPFVADKQQKMRFRFLPCSDVHGAQESTHVKAPRSVHGVRPDAVHPHHLSCVSPRHAPSGVKTSGSGSPCRRRVEVSGGRLRTWERTESMQVETVRPAPVDFSVAFRAAYRRKNRVESSGLKR